MFVILPQTFWLCYFFLTIFDDWVESLLFSLLHKAVYTVAQSIFNVISPHVLLSRGVQTCPGQPCLHISIHSPLPQTSLSSVHASHVLKQESFYSDLTFNNPFFFFNFSTHWSISWIRSTHILCLPSIRLSSWPQILLFVFSILGPQSSIKWALQIDAQCFLESNICWTIVLLFNLSLIHVFPTQLNCMSFEYNSPIL